MEVSNIISKYILEIKKITKNYNVKLLDVYKIRVSQYHSVINDSDTIRYHVVMRTKETMQYWHGESYA